MHLCDLKRVGNLRCERHCVGIHHRSRLLSILAPLIGAYGTGLAVRNEKRLAVVIILVLHRMQVMIVDRTAAVLILVPVLVGVKPRVVEWGRCLGVLGIRAEALVHLKLARCLKLLLRVEVIWLHLLLLEEALIVLILHERALTCIHKLFVRMCVGR